MNNNDAPADRQVDHDQSLPNGLVAEALLRSRRLRDEIFQGHTDGFGEPAWDSMLLLYAAKARGRPAVSVEELLAVTCAPAEIANPYIAWLTSHRLVQREGGDVALTDRGQALMSSYLEQQRLA
ncbi:hypothetical protein QP162_12730 [Sphingomonas aurantiaca]|uniref:hypothetical protein n=1 Tax=Sphingomonas aurantiaca TaxID=185949 RepID=UPI002FE130E6